MGVTRLENERHYKGALISTMAIISLDVISETFTNIGAFT